MTLTVLWPFGYPASSSSVKTASTNPAIAIDLKHYANPNVSPPSARIDRNHKARVRRPLRFWHLWKYAAFAATKGMELSAAVLSHHIFGPRKKSWGIEMTIITAFMRGAGKNSSLINIPTIRTLMSLGGLAPLPSDALVTPVTFRVKKRGLRGMLAEFDERETGSRGLSGEWVVGKRTWRRLQADWKELNRVEPCRSSPTSRERVILYIHGGAYYTSSAAAQRLISIPLAKHTDSRVFALDYRLAPETQFPGPLHDAVNAYFRLTDDLHIPPENILVAGDSAGGGLCLALLMYLRDNSYPLPSGAILMSPWVDLTMSCESWDSNAPFDVLPIPTTLPDDQLNPIALYLGDNVKRYLTHPYASPLFGDFKGLPPMLIQAGDAEVLRDEISLLAHKATSMGVQVRHEVYEDGVTPCFSTPQTTPKF
jgi:acetyl esterase/lipase